MLGSLLLPADALLAAAGSSLRINATLKPAPVGLHMINIALSGPSALGISIADR